MGYIEKFNYSKYNKFTRPEKNNNNNKHKIYIKHTSDYNKYE